MNSTPHETTTTDDPRLLRAVQEYLGEIEAGRRPERKAFLARFPVLADAMVPYLDALDAVHAASPQLNSTASGRPTPPMAEPCTAEPLGDFSIIREIGRGGMGIVYEAIQLSLGRRVALKVLPFAAALDARQLQRFKNEAQAAAQLHHANIVPVYAVGHERGVHYYAMQLIEGQNLSTLIEELRRSEAPGQAERSLPRGAGSTGSYRPDSRNGAEPGKTTAVPPAAGDTTLGLTVQLSTQRTSRSANFFRTVARLIVQAAEGLDYAHGLGIVHRDVKPANLLVDGRGNVWITDFGLAQFHAEVGLTQTGDLLGTLRYMSPEQAAGQRVLLDHRTDIYSLGATLYELLTLRPIFDGPDRQALLRQIMHDEPRPPRAVDRTIPPELETIVLKAVSKVPSERYATARDLADDLNRFLRDEPILARLPSTIQRVRKWLRRHPAVPVAGTLMLVLLAVASLVSAGFIRGAYERERQRAEEAEERFRLTRDAADEMIQLAETELADKPHMEGLRRRLLETALVYYQKLIEQRREDPDARAELAQTESRVKRILDDLALLQGSGQLALLKEESVVDDLATTVEEREKIKQLSERLEERQRKTFGDFFRLTERQRQERFIEVARSNEAAVAEVLTPGQRRRLAQIDLQRRGPGAFREPDVARELKLTADQKTRIEAIIFDTYSVVQGTGRMIGFPAPPVRGGPGPQGVPAFRPEPPGGEDWRKAVEEKRKAASERILAVLTEEQRKQWRGMTGEPFKGELRRFGPVPFGPRG